MREEGSIALVGTEAELPCESPRAPRRDILHHRCVEPHTSKSGSLALIISCRFVLSSGPRSCLYCHLSGTKGHFISFASSRRLLTSSGSRAERVKEQVRILQQVQPQHSRHQSLKKAFSHLLPALSPCRQPRGEGRGAGLPSVPLGCTALQVNGSLQPLKRLLAGSHAGWWLPGREEPLQKRQEETCSPVWGEDNGVNSTEDLSPLLR